MSVTRHFARLYNDGSLNVGRGGDAEDLAIKRLSGSTDDDDTQLVEVEVRVVRWIARKGLTLVENGQHWTVHYREWVADRPDIARLGLIEQMEAYLKENPEHAA